MGESTLFSRVGGMAFFEELVERFYAGVEGDPPLRALYPDDLSAPKADLAQFLAQFWGGPPAYSIRKGHPRLRGRHARFAIDDAMAERWLVHMHAAIDEAVGVSELDREQLGNHVEGAARFLVNQR